MFYNRNEIFQYFVEKVDLILEFCALKLLAQLANTKTTPENKTNIESAWEDK